ncbi:MAG: hypothetical protein O4861_24125 [Trichodesmium sp. St16_bin4-tuft]|nr:hypothetical protein [Trichodesmium sp. St16_bin4-tuft]MDE5101951.1 hypothetical protein [Trichodesmium sp. St19_bin2]
MVSSGLRAAVQEKLCKTLVRNSLTKLLLCIGSSLGAGRLAYTNFFVALSAVLPSKRHQAVGKEKGKTSLH